jgi:hypothetical protein
MHSLFEWTRWSNRNWCLKARGHTYGTSARPPPIRVRFRSVRGSVFDASSPPASLHRSQLPPRRPQPLEAPQLQPLASTALVAPQKTTLHSSHTHSAHALQPCALVLSGIRFPMQRIVVNCAEMRSLAVAILQHFCQQPADLLDGHLLSSNVLPFVFLVLRSLHADVRELRGE